MAAAFALIVNPSQAQEYLKALGLKVSDFPTVQTDDGDSYEQDRERAVDVHDPVAKNTLKNFLG